MSSGDVIVLGIVYFCMAKIHYLNWDKTSGIESSEDEMSPRHAFSALHVIDEEELGHMPKSWYQEVCVVPDLGVEELYNAFQGGVRFDVDSIENPEVFKEAQSAYEAAQVRSMSVGDVIEVGGELHMVSSFGFSSISWNEQVPDVLVSYMET